MIKVKQYLILFFVTILLIFLYFTVDANLSISLNIHDIYYVIAVGDVYLLLLILYGFTIAIYLLFSILKIKFLQINVSIHFLGFVFFTVIILLLFDLSNQINEKVKNFKDYNDSIDFNLYLFISILILLSIQIFFIINIFIILFKKLINYLILKM